MLPLSSRQITIESAWYTGYAKVPVFQLEELCATKVRALYQRFKGRDLFDLWIALTRLKVDPMGIVSAFKAYRLEGLTRDLVERNLEAKLADRDFCCDCDSLIFGGVERFGYDVQEAGCLVIEEVISLI